MVGRLDGVKVHKRSKSIGGSSTFDGQVWYYEYGVMILMDGICYYYWYDLKSAD